MEKETVHLPDDTLPGFNYLDQLSEVTDDDIDEAIKDWKQRYKDNDLKNILEAEIINE